MTAPAFAVVDENTASWVLRKMAAIEAEAARVKAQAAARLEELASDSRALHARFDSELEAFARTEAERRRRKTITLLDGSLCLRSVPARLVIADGQAALEWAQVNLPGAIIETTTETLDKAALFEAAESTGEVIPGVDTIPAREAFAVKFPNSKADAVDTA